MTGGRQWWAALVAAVFLTAVAGVAGMGQRYRIAELPVEEREPARTVVVGELARYEDELFAYLMFDYVRTQAALEGKEVLLSYGESQGRLEYRLRVVLGKDLVNEFVRLEQIAGAFPFFQGDWMVMDERVLARQREQTARLVEAYNQPAYRKLEQLSAREVADYARRFIRFKSATDPRIRKQLEPVPRALSREEAGKLAADIVTVAHFYELPLDFFLGIGAMENNYMNVKGDLGNTVWKKRPAKGDVILRRAKGRVLTLNESSGVWQITRETLRYAHRLYLRDKRNYGELPEHLRPPNELDIDGLDHEVLTTYAGLLLRDLLDRFEGDVRLAVGAYNGGPGNPNAKYEEGVRRTAEYARRMLEQAAALRER